MNNSIYIIHQNIRSLRKNFDLFLYDITVNDLLADIIILSEIWIYSSEADFYSIPRYKLFFKCNDTYRSGGVAVYVKDSITNVNFINIVCDSADIMFLSFEFSECNFHLLAIYRLIFQPIDTFISEFQKLFSDNSSTFKSIKNLFWIGDLNIPLNVDEVTTDNYKSLMAINGLECLINEPTRITDVSQTCIDHCYARISSKNRIAVDASVIHAGHTDHSMCRVNVHVVGRGRGGGGSAPAASPSPTARYRTDYVLFRQLLGVADWSNVFNQYDASAAFDAFFNIFQQIEAQSKIVINDSGKKEAKKIKPWMNEVISSKIRKRNKIFNLVKKHPVNENLKSYYKTYRNRLQNDIKQLKDSYYKQKFEKCQGNSKATWKMINEITGQSRSNDYTIKLEVSNILVEDPITVANEFNKYFLNIVEELNLSSSISQNFLSLDYKNIFPDKCEINSLFLDEVSPEELAAVVKSLKNNTCPGIDGVSSTTLKEVLDKILNVLLYVVNFSFQSGVFPSKLKNSVVIPIFKSGSKLFCNNYRPISLLSCFSKVYEKLMKQKLIKFFNTTNFFSCKQFGFRAKLNTENALLNFLTNIYEGLNEGKIVSGLFLDIKKAFDTVDHDILLNKLYKCGIRGIAHNWFKSYLLERQQCVRINSVVSGMGLVKCGVPQGSVLGAILFIVYINDLCSGRFHGNLTSFADDTALCYAEDDCESVKMAMNSDLKALQWWFTVNHMLLSAEKTKYINFSLRKNLKFFDDIKYKCSNCIEKGIICRNKCKIVGQTNEIKYLGLYLDEEVSWKVHILKLKNKINNILRYFYFLKDMINYEVMRSLYFALIQSRVEYGIIFWGNAYDTYLNSIYVQQKHLLRLISFKDKFEPSRPLFLETKILPLKYLYVYKVLKMFFSRSGNISNNENLYKNKLRNANQFKLPRPRNSFYTRTYNFVAPKFYNLLPEDIKNSFNKIKFANNLKKWLFGQENIDFLFRILK